MSEYFHEKWAYYDRLRNAPAYVTDGLQLWLDGINNTRDGHSATTHIWEDLSGNNYDFLPRNSGMYPTVGASYFTGFSGDTFFVSQANGLDHLADMTSPGTLECVYMITSQRTNTMQVFGFKNGVGVASLQSKLCVPHAGGLIIGGRQTSSTNARWRYDTFMTDDDLNVVLSASITYTGTSDIADALFNGVELDGLNPQDTGWGNAGGHCVGNRWHTTSTTPYYMQGRIYCIRYYDRVLSDAEREQNRQVDIRRFGA